MGVRDCVVDCACRWGSGDHCVKELADMNVPSESPYAHLLALVRASAVSLRGSNFFFPNCVLCIFPSCVKWPLPLLLVLILGVPI